MQRMKGDAHARADHELVAVDLQRQAQRIEQAVGERDRIGRRPELRHHQQELVALGTPEHRRGRQRVAQPLDHRDQKTVAPALTERVVDVLEAVEVDVEQGERRHRGQSGHGLVMQPLEHRRPVGQPGERVVAREVIEARLVAAQRADVGHHHHVVPRPPGLSGQHREIHPVMTLATVVARQRALALPAADTAQRGQHLATKAVVEEVPALAAQPLEIEPGDPGEGLVDLQRMQRLVDQQHALGRGLDHLGPQSHGLEDRFALGDVLHAADHRLRPTGLATAQYPAHMQHQLAPLGPDPAVREVETVGVDADGLELAVGAVAIIGVDAREVLGTRCLRRQAEHPQVGVGAGVLAGLEGIGPVAELGEIEGFVEAGAVLLELGDHLGGLHHEAYPVAQQGFVDRLGQVVGGAGLEGLLDGVVVVKPGLDQDRRAAVGTHAPQFAADLEAVGPRHLHVEHHAVEALGGGEHQRFMAVGRACHGKAEFGEARAHQHARQRVVVDDQRAPHPHHRRDRCHHGRDRALVAHRPGHA